MRIILILVILLLTSCSIQNETISGIYQTKWNTKLFLNEDSTFTYSWRYDMISGETYGDWKVIGRKLILNSDPIILRDTTPEFIELEVAQTKTPNVTIDLLWQDTNEILIGPTGVMIQNGDTVAKKATDVDGRIIFRKQKADSIKIYFPGLKDILITDFTNDYYKILAVEKPFQPSDFFENEIWKIKQNRIRDKSTKRTFFKQKQ